MLIACITYVLPLLRALPGLLGLGSLRLLAPWEGHGPWLPSWASFQGQGSRSAGSQGQEPQEGEVINIVIMRISMVLAWY